MLVFALAARADIQDASDTNEAPVAQPVGPDNRTAGHGATRAAGQSRRSNHAARCSSCGARVRPLGRCDAIARRVIRCHRDRIIVRCWRQRHRFRRAAPPAAPDGRPRWPRCDSTRRPRLIMRAITPRRCASSPTSSTRSRLTGAWRRRSSTSPSRTANSGARATRWRPYTYQVGRFTDGPFRGNAELQRAPSSSTRASSPTRSRRSSTRSTTARAC